MVALVPDPAPGGTQQPSGGIGRPGFRGAQRIPSKPGKDRAGMGKELCVWSSVSGTTKRCASLAASSGFPDPVTGSGARWTARPRASGVSLIHRDSPHGGSERSDLKPSADDGIQRGELHPEGPFAVGRRLPSFRLAAAGSVAWCPIWGELESAGETFGEGTAQMSAHGRRERTRFHARRRPRREVASPPVRPARTTTSQSGGREVSQGQSKLWTPLNSHR